MFEGNEISFLRKRKLDLQEMVLLSTPEDVDNFERTEILLSKQNKVQLMAALSPDNLKALAHENPENFGIIILPLVTTKLLHMKDEEMLYHTAASLEELVEENTIGRDHLLGLAERLIEHLKTFNKKNLDEVWTPLIMKILKLHSCETYLDTAIELSDPVNNIST
jgi:hypothetical protein